MESVFKNWKTSASGALLFLLAGASLLGIPLPFGLTVPPDQIWPAILGGIGLIFAKDSNVTGGAVKQ